MKEALILLASIWVASCSNSDDDASLLEDGGLNGAWTLTNVSCFCGFPDPPEFERTTLTFDVESNEIEVLNEGGFMYFRENGTYSYTSEDSRITLEDERSYDFEIIGDTLSLQFVDEPLLADDEILYSLVRD